MRATRIFIYVGKLVNEDSVRNSDPGMTYRSGNVLVICLWHSGAAGAGA